MGKCYLRDIITSDTPATAVPDYNEADSEVAQAELPAEAPVAIEAALPAAASAIIREPEARTESISSGSSRSSSSSNNNNLKPPYTLSIAPMMEWTDRHYRYMMRGLTQHTQLYTEMIVDGTLLHRRDDLSLFLGHDECEQPLAVQLGGSSPTDVGEAAAICEAYGGFNEINLNVGCPSPRVATKACFGARLMLDPDKTRQILHEMTRRVTHTNVTVKCRIGADEKDSYDDLLSFIQTVRPSLPPSPPPTFILHARKALLSGLSPAQNRSVPPLNYPRVHSLVTAFPDCYFIINGGIQTWQDAQAHLSEEGRESWTSTLRCSIEPLAAASKV